MALELPRPAVWHRESFLREQAVAVAAAHPVWQRQINPGKVFDLTLPLDHVGEGYRAMDERHAIKTLLRP